MKITPAIIIALLIFSSLCLATCQRPAARPIHGIDTLRSIGLSIDLISPQLRAILPIGDSLIMGETTITRINETQVLTKQPKQTLVVNKGDQPRKVVNKTNIDNSDRSRVKIDESDRSRSRVKIDESERTKVRGFTLPWYVWIIAIAAFFLFLYKKLA